MFVPLLVNVRKDWVTVGPKWYNTLMTKKVQYPARSMQYTT